MSFFALHAQKTMLISICIPRKSPLLQRGEQGIKLGEDGALGGFEGFDDLDDKRKGGSSDFGLLLMSGVDHKREAASFLVRPSASHYPAYLSRNTFFCTFPIALRGSSVTTTQRLGTLKWASWPCAGPGWIRGYGGPGALHAKLLRSNSLGFIPKRAAAQRPLAHLLVACWVK
jgi:hypothetical protein